MAGTVEQDLRDVADALVNGTVDELYSCRRSLESAAAGLAGNPSALSPCIEKEMRRVRSLLQNAGRHYAGLAATRGVQQFGYDADGRVRHAPGITGTRVEFTG
jgi:hypothetical protein